MKYLIDTQALSYFLYDEKRLPEQIVDFIEDYENKGYVSVVSLHEIVVKNAKGQIIVPEPIVKVLPHIIETNLEIIPVNVHHIVRLETLEREAVHKDPFDRILVCQASAEKMLLVTHDARIGEYTEPCVFVV